MVLIVVNDSGQKVHLPPFVRVIESNFRDPSDARNAGIREAIARWYLPLDADDYLQPDALQWLATASAESGDDIIFSDFFEDVDEHGKLLPDGEFRHYKLPDFTCNGLIRNGAAHPVTALTPVSAWEKVGGYRRGKGWEDWDFQLRCAEAGVCSRRLAAPLFTYRKGTGFRAGYNEDIRMARELEMRADWDPYFKGEKSMACSCRGTITPSPPSQMANNQSSMVTAGVNADMVQVVYVGSKTGSVRYRGTSGTIYTFSPDEQPRWVHSSDIDLFRRLSDFRVVVDGGVTTGNLVTA